MMRKCHVRFGGRRIEKVHSYALSGLHEWNLASRLPYIIWGFQHVAGFRRRHVGASIQEAWTTSLDHVRAALDADTTAERTLLLRSTTQELRIPAMMNGDSGHRERRFRASRSLIGAKRRRQWVL